MVKKIHYIDIDEENEKEYWIAVHTTYEGFQLAYFINKNGLLKLRRSNNDIKNYLDEGVFNIFEFTDKINHKYCNLISNKCILENFSNFFGPTPQEYSSRLDLIWDHLPIRPLESRAMVII